MLQSFALSGALCFWESSKLRADFGLSIFCFIRKASPERANKHPNIGQNPVEEARNGHLLKKDRKYKALKGLYYLNIGQRPMAEGFHRSKP